MTTSQLSKSRTARHPLPTVRAKDMLHAQGYVPTAEDRAMIAAKADFLESEGLRREVHIRVEDFYTGARIGSLIFNL